MYNAFTVKKKGAIFPKNSSTNKEYFMLEKIKQSKLGLFILVLVLAAGWFIYTKLNAPQLASNLVQGSGRMDGDLINLNAKYAGRIATLPIQDGQGIKKGELIAKLESKEYEAQIEQINAQINAKNQELKAKEIEIEISQKQIPESLKKAEANLRIKSHQRDELDKNIAAQTNNVTQDIRDFERYKNLYEQNLIEKRQVELSELKYKTSNEQLLALKQKREQMNNAISVANSETVEAKAHQMTLSAMQQGIEAIKSSIVALEASKRQIDAILSEMTILSSVDGVVIEKIANEGEVVGGGSVVATLLDPSSLYLKVFVDTKQNGNLQVGNDAVIFLDAKPDEPIKAKVVRIEKRAEFTPKEVSVPSDRIQQVFAVHVKPLVPNPYLKLGLPAVGVVSMDGTGLPVSLKKVPE